MNICLSCLQSKERLESIYACEDCCREIVRNMSLDVTGRQMIHALETLGKRYRVVEPKKEVVKP